MNEVQSPTGAKISVLIVDDHAMVRQGLRTFLDLHDDSLELPIEVVGEACDGVEAVELAGQLQPDIILLDLVMPQMDGIEATRKILACSSKTRVVILTSFGEEDQAIPAIQAGAHGYLLKDIPPTELVHAIRQVHRGNVQLHPEIARKLMAAVAAQEVNVSHFLSSSRTRLTAREQEVLALIAQGLNNREIAEKMVISQKTVKTHVSNILSKLHLEDRTQAAIYALKHGLTTGRD
jgi:NarL family two-component system response regulator LiaR